MKREILLGDEAIGLGAIHSGMSGIYGYPGTPSTEIFEYVERVTKADGDIHAFWSTNEKVAYEEALGMSWAGKRALVCMKHVGLNVAADAFMNSAVTGTNGGLAAIRTIAKGESLIHPSVASKILAEFSLLSEGKGKKRGILEHDLTEREITVLQLVADGKTNKEIANVLDLSEKTVKNHVRNIFHKLHAYDRTQAAIFAIRKGIIELDPGKRD